MSDTPAILPDDPAALKAMIAALQAENAAIAAENMRVQADIGSISATLRAHEALVQALQIQMARLKKQKFGPARNVPCERSNNRNWRWSIWRLQGRLRSASHCQMTAPNSAKKSRPQPPTRRAVASPWSQRARRVNASS